MADVDTNIGSEGSSENKEERGSEKLGSYIRPLNGRFSAELAKLEKKKNQADLEIKEQDNPEAKDSHVKQNGQMTNDRVAWVVQHYGDLLKKSEHKEQSENETEPVIVAGTNVSLANDPASAYAQKLGFNASILGDSEDINEVSGISLVRFSDENQQEHNGAYRVTYDFISGDTVNRLFASYDVAPKLPEKGNEQGKEKVTDENSKDAEQNVNDGVGAGDSKSASDSKAEKKTEEQNKTLVENQNEGKAEAEQEDKSKSESEKNDVLIPEQPDILVSMEQLQKYLRSAAADKPNEYFKVDPAGKTFSFSLCGAEGVYDSENKIFKSLAINKELVPKEDLKNYTGIQLFNMVPMGSMLGEEAGKPITSEMLKEMSSRDKVIASCKDERLQELLKDIDGSCRNMTKLSKSYAGAQNKLDELGFDNSKASVPARAWNKIAGKFNLYSDSEAERMEGKGFTKRLLYKAMKPSIMSRREKMAQPREWIENFDVKMAEQYKVFKAQYDELQDIVNGVPGETAAKYSKELSRLSEGMKCFKEWEEYRNSPLFDSNSSSAIKNYAECMTHNCKLISKDLAICAGKLNHVHDESCNCCYDRQIKARSLQEEIDRCNAKPGFATPTIDCFRAFAKSASKDEIVSKGSVEAVAVDKMIALNKDRDEMVDALLKASPKLFGESRDVVGKFVDSRIDFINGVKSEDRGIEVRQTENKNVQNKNNKNSAKRKVEEEIVDTREW